VIVKVSVWELKNPTSCYGVLDPAGFGWKSGVVGKVQPQSIWEFSVDRPCQKPEIPSPAAVVADPNFRTTYKEGPPPPGLHTHLAGDTLTIVWWVEEEREYHIWDVYKRQLLRKARSSLDRAFRDLKISADGSKIFGLDGSAIEAVSMETGEVSGRVKAMQGNTLFVRGSKVGIDTDHSRGWDFRRLKKPKYGEFLDRFRLDLVNHPQIVYSHMPPRPRWIEDTITGSRVFQLPDKYVTYCMRFTWDGRYLLIWSPSGDVAIIDFGCVSPR